MITFTKTIDKHNEFEKAKVTFTIDDNDISIDDIRGEFKCFLLAIGFHPNCVNSEEE